MRTALYIRVSTEDQAREGYSIAAQKSKLQAYCLSQGWEIEDFYIDDGYSAKDLNRPEMKRMIKNIQKGLIDCVLVYRLDRLTRSVLDLYKLLEIFEKHNCKFKSATEVYDTTTAMGRMFITIVAALAQWERENIGERVKIGLYQKVKEGGWHGGRTPYGYRQGEEGDNLEIDEEEAKTVRLIYDLYLSGKGDHRIAGILNRMGRRTRNGNEWTGKVIRDILQNPAYTGNIRYMGEVHQGFMPAIISREIFEQAQKSRESRRGKHPRRNASTYLFSGVMKCGRCGAWMNGKANYKVLNGKQFHYKLYVCINKITGACDMPLLNEADIESTLVQFLSQYRDDAVSLEVAAAMEKQDSIQEEMKAIEHQLEQIKKRKRKWQVAYANEVITLDDLRELTKKDNELEKTLQQRYEDLKAQSAEEQKSPELIAAIISHFLENWAFLTEEEKKECIRMYIKEFSVHASSERPNQYRKREIFISNIEFN
ncbi:MAG: recombinase family protein [candidate division KSB1 bacterium]|nr:recombinase family protein [candidate division KSB1 bacterium]